jgi:hypothetical protein
MSNEELHKQLEQCESELGNAIIEIGRIKVDFQNKMAKAVSAVARIQTRLSVVTDVIRQAI